MKIQGAVVKEQGVTFSIFIVKSHVMSSASAREDARRGVSQVLPSPVILMSQDSKGVPTYEGRKDIVKFLANIDPTRIPWREYTIG